MRDDEPKVIVLGATGALGRALGTALAGRGAKLALLGRSEEALAALADELGAPVHAVVDLLDTAGVAAAVEAAGDELGGLDGLVVATGVAAFGAAMDEDDAIVEELFAVNALGPMAAVRAAAKQMSSGGSIAVLSAVLVDVPTAGMAAYSASKAALSCWLEVTRRELRRAKIDLLDARPPHMETGLAERALAGQVPKMPAGHDIDEVVTLIIDGLYSGKKELVADLKEGTVSLR